ncbi:MAG: hypothetical protein HOP10_15425 [Chitinophagaceae bacterium]|nr:hypothetical protein [Chitinophagaceae bacterium]
MPRFFFIATCLSFLLFSCKQKKVSVVNERDYVAYLKPGLVQAEKKKNADEISFWQQRLLNDTGSYVNKLELAKNYLHCFKLTGGISSLVTGDSLLKRSSDKLANTEANILFALSQNSITQHQFNSAALYNEAASKVNGDPYVIRLLEFDTKMELGQYADAQKALNSLKDREAFDYLIRKAKWEDHTGNSDESIRLMELAFEKIKNKKKSLYCWTLSNLADMYGHAGRIKESYNAYLDVLKKDPSNLYCLKGIAWIAYSNDGNNQAAKEILQFILSQTNMPDLKLILAEIAAKENDITEKDRLIKEFVKEVQQPGYGAMYNKYLINIYTDELNQYDKAIAIAENELKNRFTPETCDWLAWSYYNSGDKIKALEYAKSYVFKRTFEPGALMHTAFIFADNGKKKEARAILNDCLASSFELGPAATEMIKEKLESL